MNIASTLILYCASIRALRNSIWLMNMFLTFLQTSTTVVGRLSSKALPIQSPVLWQQSKKCDTLTNEV